MNNKNFIRDFSINEGSPKVAFTSLVHGNEYSGFQINLDLYIKYALGKSIGSADFFPICNMEGYLNNKREHPDHGDLNRNPLKSKYMNKIYKNRIQDSDFYIDLHSWNNNSIPFILVNQIDPNKVGEKKAQEMKKKILNFASEIKLPLLVDTRNNTGYLIEKSAKRGIPSIIIELGPHNLKPRYVNFYSDSIIRSIKKLNSNSNPNYDKIYERKYIENEKDVRVQPIVATGRHVDKGDKICKIKDNKERYVHAPDSGFITAYNNSIKSNFKDICHFALNNDISIIG